MDPLSSAIAVVSATLAVSRGVHLFIKAIKNAPAEIDTIANEVQDLRVVISSVELSIKTNSDTEWNIDPECILPTILRRIDDKLRQLEELLRRYCDTKQGKVVFSQSLDWSRRGKEKAEKIKSELSFLKWSLNTSVGSLAASTSRRIGFTLDKVELEVRYLNDKFRQSSNELQQQEHQSRAAIRDITESQDNMVRCINEKMNDMKLELSESNTNMFLSGQLNSLLPPTAVAVHLSLQQRSMCVPSCACICHQWRQHRTPRMLEKLMGSFFIGYSGVPLIAKTCTVQSCRFKATYAMKMCYRFPLWMLTRAVTFAAYSRYGQPTAGLSMARIRPHSAQVFAFSEAGNVAGLRYIFNHGLASPFDVSAETGDQPLHITTTHGYVEASRLLVGYGGDPHAYDTDQNTTPHGCAWSMILAQNISPKETQQLAALFPDVNASNEFPYLHELVLGLKHGSLDDAAQRDGFNINDRDAVGNTALQWACLRGDVQATQWLLSRGADPNIPNICIGRTPLMAACTSVSVPCIKSLLDYDVDVNVCNNNGMNALIYLVEEERTPQPMADIIEATELLIARDINLERLGRHQMCCLARAARTQMIEVMEIVLANGVDINRRNNFGLTALTRSIAWSANRSVAYLLRRGASYTGDYATDIDGRTLLHHVALNPSAAVINILLEQHVARLDPFSQDKDGFTAEDYFNRHTDLEEDIGRLFRRLIADTHSSLREPQNTECEPQVTELDDSQEDLSFYDALECQGQLHCGSEIDL